MDDSPDQIPVIKGQTTIDEMILAAEREAASGIGNRDQGEPGTPAESPARRTPVPGAAPRPSMQKIRAAVAKRFKERGI